MFRLSITRKLIILFFFVAVMAVSIIGIYSYINAKNALLIRTFDQLTSIRVVKKKQIEQFFYERFNNVNYFSKSSFTLSVFNQIENDKDQLNFIFPLKNLDFQVYGFNRMYLVSKSDSGFILFEYNGRSVVQIQNQWLKYQLKSLILSNHSYEHILISDFKNPPSDTVSPVCFLGKQVLNENKETIGYIFLEISVKIINNIMLEISPENGLGSSGEVYLVGKDMKMRSNSRFIKNSVMKTVVNTLSVQNAFKNITGTSIIDDYRTVNVLSSFDKINIFGLDWVILSEIDYEEAMIPIISIRNDIIFLSIIICVFLFSVVHFISKTITQPIVRLTKAIQQTGEGNFNIKLPSSTFDEIGVLTESFNQMSDQLNIERNKTLTSLFDGQEMERQRVSRELHDSLGQKLVAVKLQLESISGKNEKNEDKTLSEVKTEISNIINEIREISYDLAPTNIRDVDINVALRNLCKSIQKSTSSEIEFSCYGSCGISDIKKKVYLYRIVQEAVNNSLKHSNAGKIQVQIIGKEDLIILIIEDNGNGFIFNEQSMDQGNGLNNMIERASVINAEIDIETDLNSGTTIRVKCPK